MFCSECGAEINDKAVVCPKCGVPVVLNSEAVPNHLAGAILSTLFCCLLGGIVAIVYATRVNTKLAQGDLAGATVASNKARFWIIISVIWGLVVGLPLNIWIWCVSLAGGLAGL